MALINKCIYYILLFFLAFICLAFLCFSLSVLVIIVYHKQVNECSTTFCCCSFALVFCSLFILTKSFEFILAYSLSCVLTKEMGVSYLQMHFTGDGNSIECQHRTEFIRVQIVLVDDYFVRNLIFFELSMFFRKTFQK